LVYSPISPTRSAASVICSMLALEMDIRKVECKVNSLQVGLKTEQRKRCVKMFFLNFPE
jgi:hypothetical protein